MKNKFTILMTILVLLALILSACGGGTTAEPEVEAPAEEAPAEDVLDMLKKENLELIGTIPEDQTVYEFDLEGRPTIELPENNNAVQAAFEIFDKIIL